MSSQPAINYKKAEKVVLSLGFQKRPQKGTSHIHFKHPKTGNKVTLPNYGKENYGPDLLSNICRQMGVKKGQFFKILKQK